jgi:UPF0271 protein
MGESFGRYTIGYDDQILELISSANVACGFHASDPHVMRHTVNVAKKLGVRVGAHPGLPDMMGFGRRAMSVSAAELKDMFTYQIGALKAFVEAAGTKLQHVLQHGILTSMAENDESLGQAIIESILEIDPNLIYMCLEGSYLPEMARKMGLKVSMVALADRAYEPNMRLVSRKLPGAVIQDLKQVEERVEQLLETGEVLTVEGQRVPLNFDTILLHGDSEHALQVAKTVSATVKRLGVEVKPMSELV